MFNNHKPFRPASGLNLRNIENGINTTTIPGLGVVETYGHGISWKRVSVLKDTSVITDKRDRFERRNALVNSIAEIGEFEYALAVSPTVGGKRVAQCSFCNAHHNWCVFYRDNKGKYLGWSGTDCFGEICKNLSLPAADAMIETIKSERTRCEKFRRTMEKVNDFKRDFPGLYEERKVLSGNLNPYNRLWHEVMARLNDSRGVDESWLADCENGLFDRNVRRRNPDTGIWGPHTDQQARRIPKFLQVISAKAVAGMPIASIIAFLNERYTQEKTPHPVPAPSVTVVNPAPEAPPIDVITPAPEPLPSPVDQDALQAKAKKLLDTGNYSWANVLHRAAAGDKVVGKAINFIEKTYLDAFGHASV